MESSKKQRNKRNQREGQEQKNTKSTSNKESTTVDPKQPILKEWKSQPQRAPRHPRNEHATSSDSKSNGLQTPSTPIITGTKLETQELVVDHSNLKRETEEIAQLNKKFTKRKITSNWHRYSAPKGSEDPSGEDVSAPADFTDLLQVPVSRGGHLTLKDEQDWSSGSGTALCSYFALDLNKLNESLACIPFYDQLHIPKNVYTVEEIKAFDDLAKENTKTLNTESGFMHSGSNMLTQDAISHKHKIAQDVAQKVTSDLKEEHILIDMCNQTKQNVNSHTFADLKICKKDNVTIGHLVEEENVVSSNCNQPNINDNDSSNIDSNFTNLLLDSIEKKSELRKSKVNTSSESKVIQNGSLDNRNVAVQYAVVALSNNQNEVPSDNANNLELDDDDDLDFLLSLKTPAPNSKKIGYQPSITGKKGSGPLKADSSQLPADEKSSELDDWLDSVLED